MKNQILTLLLFSFGVCFSQGDKILDTIYANEFINTSLFFPDRVRQGTVGAPNFVFSFNEDKAQYFGLIKALPGRDSNLLVLTQDGSIYSYILSYREELPKLNYFIRQEESIGNELPASDSLKTAGQQRKMSALWEADSITRRKTVLENLSSYYLKTSSGNIKTIRKRGLKLRAENMFYYGDEVFLVLEVANRSGINFELDYVNIYLTRGNRKRNASFQKLLKEAVYEHELPEMVMDRQKRQFVLVLPKFSVGENERIEVEVREKKGNRYLRMRFKG